MWLRMAPPEASQAQPCDRSSLPHEVGSREPPSPQIKAENGHHCRTVTRELRSPAKCRDPWSKGAIPHPPRQDARTSPSGSAAQKRPSSRRQPHWGSNAEPGKRPARPSVLRKSYRIKEPPSQKQKLQHPEKRHGWSQQRDLKISIISIFREIREVIVVMKREWALI